MTKHDSPHLHANGTNWQAAMTLAERLAVIGRFETPKSKLPAKSVRQSARWRLEHHADLRRSGILAAIPLTPPDWLAWFHNAYAKAESPETVNAAARGFLWSVAPLISAAHRNVRTALETAPAGVVPTAATDRDALLDSLEGSLRQRLYDALVKTLVLELAVASRHRVLVGNTGEERHAFFCNCLADPTFARQLLEQYPVLVRRLATMARNWVAANLRLIQRLSADRQALRSTFFANRDPGPLLSVAAAGDTHRGGQAVAILQFESGQRLVYKPRSVALEECYFELAGWLNRAGFNPDLREVSTLDRGDYGWMEFVDARPCRDLAEVERFFLRQGVQVALAYAFGGTDLHFENVITHGEYPVLVDLETIFQAPPQPAGLSGATASAWRALRMSVMGTLLLPEPLFPAAGDHWIDFSALGYSEGQLTPFRVPVWHHDGSDSMRLSHERITMQGGAARPELDNAQVPASPQVDLIIEGLCRAYDFLSANKAKLLSQASPLATGLGKPARNVLRGTAWYGQLLDALHHPRYLSDAIAAEAFLHNQLRAASPDAPWLSATEDAEVDQLLAGDIPYFSAPVGGGGSGDGWEQARARIGALNAADRERQCWLTRVAMADLSAPNLPARKSRPASSVEPTSAALIATASRIGARIGELAIRDGDRATWLVPAIIDKKRLMTTTAGFELYNGLAGIALFLAQLGVATGVESHLDLARAAITEALALYRATEPEPLAPGAHDGIGGFCYALLQIAQLLDRQDWIYQSNQILRRNARRMARWRQLDLISGLAGWLAAALACSQSSQDPALINRLRPAADRLRRIAESRRKADRVLLPDNSDAGLAHGRAGIGFALMRWATVTGDDAFRTAATRLCDFDTKTFEEVSPTAADPHRAPHLGWCRGWLGPALASLRNLKPGQPIAAEDASWFRLISEEIVTFGVDGPLCLCHGALGHLEFLDAMVESGCLSDPKSATAWRRRLLARLTAGDWVCDEFHALESPGLMLGLAGTGYALLRTAQPQSAPSVLTLEPGFACS
jgi:type 2 lantibiotic biosynthesis protein LanM